MASIRRIAVLLVTATAVAAAADPPAVATHAISHLSTGGPAVRSVATQLRSAALRPAVSDPTANAPLSQAFYFDCVQPPIDTSACDRAALADFDRARAQENPPLGPMTLPDNYDSLPPATQLFVLANIDRVDHGLPPISGLSSALDTYAQGGANSNSDPQFPGWTLEGGSNWASPTSPLLSEFVWVYDDGPGSWNGDCTSANPSGCWGHRHNVLAAWDSPRLMGAAQTGTDAELFLGADSHDTADAANWSAITGHFPVGLSTISVRVDPKSSPSARITAWASGEAMDVTAAVTKGATDWQVTVPPACNLAAGQTCELTVQYVGTAAAPQPGTLTVTGPNGSREVALSAGAPDPSGLSVSRSRATLRGGATGTISGTLIDTANHAGISGTAVSLQAEPASGGTWRTVHSTSTDSGGNVSLAVRPSAATSYRLAYAGTATHAAATSSATTMRVEPVVTLTASSGAGSKHSFAMAMTPARSGAAYQLLLRRPGSRSFSTAAAGSFGHNGTAKRTLRLPRGRSKLKLLAPAGGGQLAATSNTVTVRVG